MFNVYHETRKTLPIVNFSYLHSVPLTTIVKAGHGRKFTRAEAKRGLIASCNFQLRTINNSLEIRVITSIHLNGAG